MSQGWTCITAPAAVLNESGIDTDVIFPARFLLRMDKQGLGECLFADRKSADGQVGSAFDLELVDGERVQILIAGAQFGCGSSREHAVWSLVDCGIRAVIAPSFGEIFANNAARNGLAAIVCSDDAMTALRNSAQSTPLTIDLKAQSITAPKLSKLTFNMPTADREAIINGWDEIDMLTKQHAQDLAQFEQGYKTRRPWMFAGGRGLYDLV